jgi:hypothetical protein
MFSWIFLTSEGGSIRFSQEECAGDLDVKMPKMNDAEIEQATQKMTNAFRHDG